MKSQNAQIKAYLKSGKSLTALDGLYQFGSLNLKARIFDLRAEGMNIESPLVAITSGGKTKYVSRYKLVK